MSTTTTPTTPMTPADGRHLRRVARALDAALWLVALAVGVYSLNNVHQVAIAHDTADPQAWLLAPIVDVALFGGITADSVLSRYGVRPSGWGTALRWFCGGATWTLNVWDAAASGDLGAIVSHSIPPIVLILLAEAAPRYRQQFARLAAGTVTPAPLDDTASTIHTVSVVGAPAASVTSMPTGASDAVTPAPPVPVPVPRTGTPRRSRTGTSRRTASGTRTARRTDAELIAALADVPRDADGTVPVRRATAALGCGPDRARRLLTSQGLLRTSQDSDTPTVAVPAVA